MSIPASNIVDVVSNVLGNVGNAPVLNGVFLSKNPLVPNDGVLTFFSSEAVGEYFGTSSDEYDLASRVYFQGYKGSILRAGALLISSYNEVSDEAFLKSDFLDISIAKLQTFNGDFNITVNGVVKNTGFIDLSLVASFTAAAIVIGAAINNGGTDVTVVWNSSTKTFIISTVSVGSTAALTYATDVIGSTLAADLRFTVEQDATLSQGSDADSPTTAIQRLVLKTSAWFSFTTLWEPTLVDKLEFSQITSELEKYCYVAWDTDQDSIVAASATCFACLVDNAKYDGTFTVGGDDADAVSQGKTLAELTLDLAVFVQGFVAAVDFQLLNGRVNAQGVQLAGLLPTVKNQTSYQNLIANGYNVYGEFANATNDWIFLSDGQLSGKFLWLDSFYGAVYLGAQLQTAGMELLINSQPPGSIPYNQVGYDTISLALDQPIQDALNFGTIRAGIDLSEAQIAAVNSQAGLDISSQLKNNGYYLQILSPGQQAEQNRESPIINFWYTDGQSINKLKINAVDIL